MQVSKQTKPANQRSSGENALSASQVSVRIPQPGYSGQDLTRGSLFLSVRGYIVSRQEHGFYLSMCSLLTEGREILNNVSLGSSFVTY